MPCNRSSQDDRLYDAVVFATGYRPMDPASILNDAARFCEVDDHGRMLSGIAAPAASEAQAMLIDHSAGCVAQPFLRIGSPHA